MNTRIAGLSIVVTPEAVATVLPLSAASAATTRAGRRAMADIITGADGRLAVIAGPCSIHDPAATLEYAEFLGRMRERHGDDLEIVMRTYTEKPRTEVDWKGFAYDPYLDGSNNISVGLIATRMLMGRITGLGVPVAAEPLNALTPQYVDGLVTYNGVGARNVTDQTARERVSGFSAVIGFKNSPEGSIDAAVQAVIAARAPHEFLGIDRHGMSAQLSTTGNETGHVILRGDKDGPNYSAAHIGDTRAKLRARGLPEVVVVDASHGNSQKNHLRQIDVVHDLAGQVAGGETGDPRCDAREQPRRRAAEPRPGASGRARVRQERHRRLRRPRHDRGDAGRAGGCRPGTPAESGGRRDRAGGRAPGHRWPCRCAGWAGASWSRSLCGSSSTGSARSGRPPARSRPSWSSVGVGSRRRVRRRRPDLPGPTEPLGLAQVAPRKSGVRFSTNARTPSRPSGSAADSAISRASSSSCSSSVRIAALRTRARVRTIARTGPAATWCASAMVDVVHLVVLDQPRDQAEQVGLGGA